MRFRDAILSVLACGSLCTHAVVADVTAESVQQLKSMLTPLGAEKAGNTDGSIPAWIGGFTDADAAFANGRRADPFAGDKVLLTITAKNLDQYADKLTDGQKALLKKYPNTYRLDVYPTRRTAAAPQWFYDNTFKSATRAKLNGTNLEGSQGGIPFPIPKNGTEAMWNHNMRWRGESYRVDQPNYEGLENGGHVLVSDLIIDFQYPYSLKDFSADKTTGEYTLAYTKTIAPPFRAGQAFINRTHVIDDDTKVWIYLVGQRRARRLPNACCETPTQSSSGVALYDELEVWEGRLDRFNWKLLGKKAMYIPYNDNKQLLAATDVDLLGAHHPNPDYVRWELHRVWVVEADLAVGQRHPAAKNIYYLDEDTWSAVLADRWDARGQLWRTLWGYPILLSDFPVVTTQLDYGIADLISGGWFTQFVHSKSGNPVQKMPRFPDTYFTPETMTSGGLR